MSSPEPRPPHAPHPAGAERGAATLLTTVVVLFCISLLTLYATRVAVTEQRLAANDIRAQQALAAAQAGLAAALDTLPGKVLDAVRFDADGRTRFAGPAAGLPDGAGFTTMLETVAGHPFRTDLLSIRALGRSADGSSTRAVRQTVAFVPWVVHPPPEALTARDMSGGDGTTRAAFFSAIFGRPRAAVREHAVPVPCRRCPGARLDDAGRFLWVGSSEDGVALTGGRIGRAGRPVILIVDGDLGVTQDTHVTGLVYVAGDLRPGPGRFTVRGALAVEGRADAAAGLVHDRAAIERVRRLGRYARVAGSWSDF